MDGNTNEYNAPEEQLDWIQMHQGFETSLGETTREKMKRKLKENPLVPIGCAATASALIFGLYSFRNGNRKMSQLMMRTRIAAQGFTVLALVSGVVMSIGNKE